MQAELVSTIKKVEELSHKHEELETEALFAKKRLSEQQKYQKELEEREVKLNSDYIQLLEKQNSGTQERVNVKELEDKVLTLQAQVGEIEGENRVLQTKLESTNSSLSNVVKEMYSMLEEHEPSKLANMDVDSEEEDEEMEDDEMHPMMVGAPGNNRAIQHQMPSS